MELSVSERLVLLNILPVEGDLTTLRIVRDLKKELSFDEEEHSALSFIQDESSIQWDQTVEVFKDVPIGDKATDVIKEAFAQADRQKTLTLAHLEVYERFEEEATNGA